MENTFGEPMGRNARDRLEASNNANAAADRLIEIPRQANLRHKNSVSDGLL